MIQKAVDLEDAAAEIFPVGQNPVFKSLHNFRRHLRGIFSSEL